MPPRAAKKLKVEKVAPMKKQNKKATKPATPPEAFSLDLCKGWFSSLLVSNESDIGPEGIEQICLLLNIDITSIDILLIAFKLNAAQMGFFTLNEWTSGMQKLQYFILISDVIQSIN